MPVFPRAAKAMPRLVTPPRFPQAMQSWGQSGKGQMRSTGILGREWEETYPVLDTALPAVRALVTAINRGLREGLVWDVQHPYWQRRSGVGGGTPLVNGANQTGAVLVVDGASPSVTGWLRAGDLIQVLGTPVVLDVTADVNTDSGGNASIPIHPPLFAGQSPANNAPVTIDPTTIFFKAVLAEVGEFPQMDSTRYIDAGLTLTWREQPG